MKIHFLLSIIILLFCGCKEADEKKGQAHAFKKPNIVFLIADDWSYPHAGAYGDPVVRTPTFDRLAKEGALFKNAYCASPSCSPSRASILTGRYPHQLESAGNLWSIIPNKFPNWVTILAGDGYYAGSTRKGWGPGDYLSGGYTENPAGKRYQSFKEFFEQRPKDQPFTFWFGSTDPHRDYTPNTGLSTGMSLDQVVVPEFLPDLPCVRNDMLDYYFEVERFDRECGQIIAMLEKAGELDNTIIVMTSDNGMPFPRAKANVYDYGARLPLAIRWPEKIKKSMVINDFVSFVDFAPTLLSAAGLEPDPSMSGKSIWPLFSQPAGSNGRDQVFLERERHANARKGDLSYPVRAVRNHDFLYIRNLMPERWPAGDAQVHRSVGQWGDVDNSITKFLIMNMENKNPTTGTDYFQLSFGLRPAEELYAVRDDPYQLHNLVSDASHQTTLIQMRNQLQRWMEDTGDLRATDPTSPYWDTVKYVPTYQFQNVDVTAEIGAYRMVSPTGNSATRASGISCLD